MNFTSLISAKTKFSKFFSYNVTKAGMLMCVFAFTFSFIELLIRICFQTEVIARFLALSRETPWGIFTSILIHGDFNHLFLNLFSFTLLFAILLALGWGMEKFASRTVVLLNMRDVGKGFGYVVFLSILVSGIITYYHILANVIGKPCVGISGVNYAMEGYVIGLLVILLVYAVYLTVKLRSRIKHIVKEPKKIALLVISLIAIVLGSSYLLHQILNVKVFLVIEPGVNYVAHLSGFLTGLSVSIFLMIKRRHDT